MPRSVSIWESARLRATQLRRPNSARTMPSHAFAQPSCRCGSGIFEVSPILPVLKLQLSLNAVPDKRPGPLKSLQNRVKTQAQLAGDFASLLSFEVVELASLAQLVGQ